MQHTGISNGNAERGSAALAGVGSPGKPKQPVPPGSNKDLSEQLVVSTMLDIPEARAVVKGNGDDQRPDGDGRRTRGTSGTSEAAAAPGGPRRQSVGIRVLRVLLQAVLLGGYILLCLYLGLGIYLSHMDIQERFRFDSLPPARWRLVRASAVLVAIVGSIVGGLCFLWGVATAIWQKLPRPWWMRYTLGTAPALAYGVFVVMPLTIAVMETKNRYRTTSRKLLL